MHSFGIDTARRPYSAPIHTSSRWNWAGGGCCDHDQAYPTHTKVPENAFGDATHYTSVLYLRGSGVRVHLREE